MLSLDNTMPKQRNTIWAVCILFFCAAGIALLFWNQEIKYLLPTPKPNNLTSVSAGEIIQLSAYNVSLDNNKPVLIHFFNPDCPCSRFNLKHVKELIQLHKNHFQFIAIVPAYADINSAKEKLENLPVRIYQGNVKNEITKAFGVYATPQAVLLTADQKIYYKGNYNKARYCTLKESSYAALAMESLLRNESPPSFGLLASTAYGCELPSNEN